MSSHAETINYKMVSTPVSVQDVEDMSQYIQEAYSVAELLSERDETKEVDSYSITEIGSTIVRLLSQPMEASGSILSEKRGAEKKDVQGGAS